MRKILVIGAGRSTSALIKYLLDNAIPEDWHVTIADMNPALAQERAEGHNRATAIEFDVHQQEQCQEEVKKADLVISMLPARMHLQVATECIRQKKHMVTASYISDEMKALHQEAVAAGVVIMNEIGVDPGIDHLSAMRVLDFLRDQGAEIKMFESFTGGLLAPESEKDNPWRYKFTWNPRNVVLAGQGVPVKFIQEGRYKYIPYHKLFRRTEIIKIDDYGKFEGYANRDSLKYREVYGLENIDTIYRGTLRRKGFCRAWDIFVQLGCTYDSFVLEGSENMTNRDFINSFLAYNPSDSVELKLMHYMKLDQDSDIMEKLEWLGVFDGTKKIGLKDATPAQILQHILMDKWALSPDDKDMIVMWHKFGYELEGELKGMESSMVFIGEEQPYTAMAQTVGYPVAIASKMILNGTISTPGVQLPITKEIYEPVLNELEGFNITFNEKETRYEGY